MVVVVCVVCVFICALMPGENGAMKTDPDLPDVASLYSSYQKVSSLSPARAVRGYLEQSEGGQEKRIHHGEIYFRKRLLDVITRVQEREEMTPFTFNLVLVDTELMVDISDERGEQVATMSAMSLIDFANHEGFDGFSGKSSVLMACFLVCQLLIVLLS